MPITPGYDPNLTSAPVPVDYGAALDPTLLAGINSSMPYSDLTAALDAAQAKSGLSRPQFYAQVQQSRPDLIKAVTGGGVQDFMSKQPQIGWLGRNLPWLIAAPAAIASFAGGGAAGLGTGDGASATTSVPSATALNAATGGATGGAFATAPVDAGVAPLATVGGAVPAGVVPGISAAANAANYGGVGSSVGNVLNNIYSGLTNPGGLLGKFIPGLIGAGTDLTGAALAANAANHAADLQSQYLNKALAFEQQRYSDAQGNFAPYIQTGQQSLAALSNRLANQPSTASLYQQFAGPIVANAQNNGSNTVRMQAPSGEIQDVPAQMAPHYQSMGAKILQ